MQRDGHFTATAGLSPACLTGTVMVMRSRDTDFITARFRYRWFSPSCGHETPREIQRGLVLAEMTSHEIFLLEHFFKDAFDGQA